MITTKKLKKDLEKLEKISDVKGNYRKEKENLLYYKKILFTARDTNDYSSAVLDCFNSLVHDSGNYLDFLIWVSENISQLENEGFNIEYLKVFDINSAAKSNS